jgi:hypothetical protein
LGIVEPGVGERVRQTAFSLFNVVDETIDIKVGATPRTGGYGAGSGKDQLLAAVTQEGDVRRTPLVDLAERDFAGLVVRFDALYDLLRYGLFYPFLPPGASSEGLRKTAWCL